LKALADLIKSNVDLIEAATKSAALEFPSPHTTFSPESEAARLLPEVVDATTRIVAAASQLITAVRPPPLSITYLGFSYHVPAALRVAVEAHVTEFLRDAGNGGAHVKDIAKATNIDPYKLARVLRLLATHHVFVEVAPDIFTNNRISSFLDSGKSVEALVAHPAQMYDGTSGITALVGHFGDESFKSSAYLPDVILDPVTSHSYDPKKAAINKAFNTDLDYFSWYEAPGNESRLIRFGHAMNGSKAFTSNNAIVGGFDWNGLKEGALIVDVGGGVGAQCLALAENFSHLRFIVQDRPAVVPEGEKEWLFLFFDNTRLQLSLAYDFMDQEQPVKDADVFIIRGILHDWADEYCVKILRNLREAAAQNTRLLIVEHIISYACKDEAANDIPGVEKPPPPAPLLPNWGQASAISYLGDLHMLALLNGQERTATHLRNLLDQTGWKLAEVRSGPGLVHLFQHAIAIPV
ncbi:S-adenosyl-L-methionine-dependent methyltransferase, partial [Dentipellis sp. KUC8613]